MSDLRARCLTAMTDAMVDEAPALFDDYAAAALDALLGVLEEHAEELEAAYWGPHWKDIEGRFPYEEGPVNSIAKRLLAVLKPTTEEEE